VTALKLLTELRRVGVVVQADGGRLVTRPAGAVP
jgi:hypothetical protein